MTVLQNIDHYLPYYQVNIILKMEIEHFLQPMDPLSKQTGTSRMTNQDIDPEEHYGKLLKKMPKANDCALVPTQCINIQFII